MDNEKEKVYCKDCKKYIVHNSMIIGVMLQPAVRWEKGVTFGRGACFHHIRTDDTPTRRVAICGDLNKLNANNDCPHYKLEPPIEIPHMEPKEEVKLPWWKFWR